MRLRTALAANLKRIRLAAKLSQEELAHRADMDRTDVSSLESGNYGATVDLLELIVDALGVEPVELLRPAEAATERNLTPSAASHPARWNRTRHDCGIVSRHWWCGSATQ